MARLDALEKQQKSSLLAAAIIGGIMGAVIVLIAMQR
jgi:hypothetical protein